MNRFLRAILILLAIGCFAVALSYPIKYELAKRSNDQDMAELSALRTQARSGQTTSPTAEPVIETSSGASTEAVLGEGPLGGSLEGVTAQTAGGTTPETQAGQAQTESGATAAGMEGAMDTSQAQPSASQSAQAALDGMTPEAQAGEGPAGSEGTVEGGNSPQEQPESGSLSQRQTAEGGALPGTQAEQSSSARQGQTEGEESTPQAAGAQLEAAQSAQAGNAAQGAAEAEAAARGDSSAQAGGREAQPAQAASGSGASNDGQAEGSDIHQPIAQDEAGSLSQQAQMARGSTSTPAPTPRPETTPTPVPTPTPDRRARSEPLPYLYKEKVVFDESLILDDMRQIYELNHDVVGWIRIPDTVVDYPVVQTDDEDYYLKHDFYGKDNANGQIIMDRNCDPYTPSYNLVISGHHMNSGKMFGNLPDYSSKSYWEKHRFIEFDTLLDHRQYVIFAAFHSADYDIDEEGFRYNADIQYRVDAEMWLEEVRQNQIYDTGIDVQYGDEFLTLTTCNRTRRRDGRFVVVARRIREGELEP